MRAAASRRMKHLASRAQAARAKSRRRSLKSLRGDRILQISEIQPSSHIGISAQACSALFLLHVPVLHWFVFLKHLDTLTCMRYPPVASCVQLNHTHQNHFPNRCQSFRSEEHFRPIDDLKSPVGFLLPENWYRPVNIVHCHFDETASLHHIMFGSV